MGYRNETEQLRAKVQQLEAQVGAIRGNLEGGRTARFGARVRRQQWVIGVFSVLASGLAILCVAPMGARYAAMERMTVADAAARPAADLPGEVVIELAVDTGSAVGTSRWGSYSTASADPRLLVYCDRDRCPYRFMNDMIYAPDGQTERRSLVGTLEAARPGYGASGISAADLEAHAAAVGAPVESLRVLTPSRNADPAPMFWVFLVFTILVMFSGAGAFLLARRAAGQEVPLPTSEDFQSKSPAVAVLLCVFTGVYQFYWVYRTTSVLRRLTGRPDLVPAVDLILSICTLGLWNFWAHYRNAEAIDEFYEDRGEPSSVKTSVVGYSLASLICSLAYFGVVHELQAQCNRLAADQGEAMRDALDEADAG